MNIWRSVKAYRLIIGFTFWSVVGYAGWSYLHSGPAPIADLADSIASADMMPHGIAGPTQYIQLHPIPIKFKSDWLGEAVSEMRSVTKSYVDAYPDVPYHVVFAIKIPPDREGADSIHALQVSINAEKIRQFNENVLVDFSEYLSIDPQGQIGRELIQAYCYGLRRERRYPITCRRTN